MSKFSVLMLTSSVETSEWNGFLEATQVFGFLLPSGRRPCQWLEAVAGGCAKKMLKSYDVDTARV